MNCAPASKGFAASLALLPWDVFSTLTFKNPAPSERHAWRLAWRFLHGAAKNLGVPYSNLLIALRSERGELGDRFHFHFLLGQTGADSNLHSLAFKLAHQWKVLTQSHAVIRPYNRALAGSDYIEGCLNGGNLYELGKFNRSDKLECSASVFKRVELTLRRGIAHRTGQAATTNTGFPLKAQSDRRGVLHVGRADRPAVADSAIENPLLSQV